MAASGLSAGESKYVDDVLTKEQPGARPLFLGAIFSSKVGKKKEKRVLAVGLYRSFLVKKGKTGYTTTKNPHHYDLVEMSGSGRERVTLKWRTRADKKGDVGLQLEFECAQVPEIVAALRAQYAVLTCGWPDEHMFKMLIGQPAALLPVDLSPPRSAAMGIAEAYGAWCAYYDYRAPSREFVYLAEDAAAEGSCDLNLSELPGIEESTDASLSTTPIMAALRHNTYFLSLVLVRVSRGGLVRDVAELLRRNTTLTRLELSVGSTSPNFQDIGRALESNARHALQIIDLSNNRLGSKGVAALGDAIAACAHGIKSLRLSSCELNDKNMVYLVYSFEKNFGVSLGIEELDLSGNSFKSGGSATLEQWFGKVGEFSRMRRLLLAGCNVNVTNIGRPIMKMASLVEIDLSDNKIDHGGAQLLIQALENTRTIRALYVAKCSLAGDWVVQLFRALTSNKAIEQTSLNVADNNLSDKDGDAFAAAVSAQSNIRILNLAGNPLSERGLSAVLAALPQCAQLHTLVIDKCLSSSKDKDASACERVASGLVQLITKAPQLKHLSLAGGFKNVVMEMLARIADNNTLDELNIKDNHGGDLFATRVADFLRTNRWLAAVYVDNNELTVTGFEALRASLRRNEALQLMDYPWRDLDKLQSSLSSSRERAKLRTVVDELQHLVRGNYRGYESSVSHQLLPPEPTPTTVMPHVQVPTHLSSYANALERPDAGVDDELSVSGSASGMSSTPGVRRK